MKKEDVVKVENQNTAKGEKKTTALQVVPVAPVQSLEEKNKQLEKEIAKLKAKIDETPQTLEEKIEFFKLKQDRIKKLSKLERQKEMLAENVLKIDEKIQLDEFECDNFSMELNAKNAGYRDDNFVKMNNPVLIRDIVVFLIQRIDDKIEVLKTEISA